MHKALETEIRVALLNPPHERAVYLPRGTLTVRTKYTTRLGNTAVALTVKDGDRILFADTGNRDEILDRATDQLSRRV